VDVDHKTHILLNQNSRSEQAPIIFRYMIGYSHFDVVGTFWSTTKIPRKCSWSYRELATDLMSVFQ